jgi:hypothetical protein
VSTTGTPPPATGQKPAAGNPPEEGAAFKEPKEKTPETPSPKYTQQDVDSITEKVKRAERDRVMKEIEDQKKQAEMTEAQKAAAKVAELESKLKESDGEMQYLRASIQLRDEARVLGHVPKVYLDAALDEAMEADPAKFDVRSVAKAAYDAFVADNKIASASAGLPPREPPRGGTPPGGSKDITQWTDAELDDLAKSGTPGSKERKENYETAMKEWDRRRFAARRKG